jgi:hypothetical protein
MEARLTLRPGQPGTKKLVAEYGARLVCVRYRYDTERRKRYKTIELIIDESEWAPRPRRPAPDALVAIQTETHERDLHRRIQQAGGKWDGKARLWRLPYQQVRQLRLIHRIVRTGGR